MGLRLLWQATPAGKSECNNSCAKHTHYCVARSAVASHWSSRSPPGFTGRGMQVMQVDILGLVKFEEV